MDGKQAYHYNTHVCIYCGECVRACPKAGALTQSNEMAPPALKKDNINNGWAVIVKDALAGREAYSAERKKQALAAAAAKAAEKAAEKKD
jgi:NADH-quinone oxidoreductase subunit I